MAPKISSGAHSFVSRNVNISMSLLTPYIKRQL